MSKKAAEQFPILLVDDEVEILFSTSFLFQSEGFANVTTENDSRRVMEVLNRQDVSLIILDLNMPYLSGFELLKIIRVEFPHIPVIVMTAANEVEMAVQCMRAGAFDYFVKPAEKGRLVASARRALEMHCLRREVSLLKSQLLAEPTVAHDPFSPIITSSSRMQSIFRYLTAIAGTEQPVLVSGETGVGKELVARSIHEASGRTGPFVAVNIAGLDDLMFSDTLFGHVKGAFTGADSAREGLAAKAAGGTLFLDEIGDLLPQSQIKLLRLLQEHEYFPLGSDLAKRCEARVVVATNRNLLEMIGEHSFRKDLYYRLNAHQVTIPPLRERYEDLPVLLDHFLDEAAAALNKKRPVVPQELYDYLAAYEFPGNVRELKALLFDAVARHEKGVLSLASFRERIGTRQPAARHDPLQFFTGSPPLTSEPRQMPTLKDAEDALIAHALRLAKGNQGVAASYLGITRQALNKRLTRKMGDDQEH